MFVRDIVMKFNNVSDNSYRTQLKKEITVLGFEHFYDVMNCK
jgi:hypothetical protein